MHYSNSNMNARGLGCTGLEYLDSIDLKIHKKPTTGMMQFWGIGNVNSGSAAQHIRSANREAIITCRGNLLQHVAVQWSTTQLTPPLN